jgi:predicted nucleic acid-binding protein
VAKIKEIEAVVVDTGILYALADRDDSWHERSVEFISDYQGQLILPCSVIPEACYLLNNFLGQKAEQSFLKSLHQRELSIDHLQPDDFVRSADLITKYNKLNLGFVDASIIAVCERREIYSILTTDRRHFSITRPKTNKPFELLP